MQYMEKLAYRNSSIELFEYLNRRLVTQTPSMVYGVVNIPSLLIKTLVFVY